METQAKHTISRIVLAQPRFTEKIVPDMPEKLMIRPLSLNTSKAIF